MELCTTTHCQKLLGFYYWTIHCASILPEVVMKTAFYFVTFFPIEKIPSAVFILCLDVFILSLNTEVPFYLFFNRHIPSRTKQMDGMGLSLPVSVCFFPPHLLFRNHSVLSCLHRFIKNHSFRPFEYMCQFFQNFRTKITNNLNLTSVSSLSFGSTSAVLLCVSTDLFRLTFFPVPPLSASFH